MKKKGHFQLKSWWWVFLFILCSMSLYSHAINTKRQVFQELTLKLDLMEQEKTLAYELNEELKLKIQSENDPAWIEMVLMRDLGVVPEGWLKVHFKK